MIYLENGMKPHLFPATSLGSRLDSVLAMVLQRVAFQKSRGLGKGLLFKGKGETMKTVTRRKYRKEDEKRE